MQCIQQLTMHTYTLLRMCLRLCMYAGTHACTYVCTSLHMYIAKRLRLRKVREVQP